MQNKDILFLIALKETIIENSKRNEETNSKFIHMKLKQDELDILELAIKNNTLGFKDLILNIYKNIN